MPTRTASKPISLDAVREAKRMGLTYLIDTAPGITRLRRGKKLTYFGPSGRPVTRASALKRVGSLVIPPAWQNVWISPNPNAHLQATGRDARGRKQYRYHPNWRASRDATKFHRMLDFGANLAAIRERTQSDLRTHGLSREKVIATVVQLLELTLIRVGNEEYARENKTYGLTTMQHRHVEVQGATLRFHFRGKSGKEHDIDVKDRRLANIVSTCQDLPGHELFHFFDEQKRKHVIGSADVNAYLREVTGEDFTAKDFRTWAGTVLAVQALWGCEESASQAQAHKNIVQAVKQVAEKLGNTPAVCRKSYIHPVVLDGYGKGALGRKTPALKRGGAGLSDDEQAVLKLLKKLVAAGVHKAKAAA